MLAVQKIKIYWEKNNRTPDGSVMRRDYLRPAKLSDKADLFGSGIFVNERDYIQTDKIYLNTDYQMKFGNRFVNASGFPESAVTERKRKHILEMQKLADKNEGCFYREGADIDIPGILISEENGAYRIKWYSLENGYAPVRTGYNEDFYVDGAKFSGRNICCRTAFVLENGENGKVEYNYRYSDAGGQHYEHYCIYFLNTDVLKRSSFICANYVKNCIQLEHLF